MKQSQLDKAMAAITDKIRVLELAREHLAEQQVNKSPKVRIVKPRADQGA